MTYHWDFSDGDENLPENSQKNPVWRFWQDAGTTYTVTLTVTNAYGSDTIVKQNYITLGTPPSAVPVAAFTSNVQSGTAPLTVQFTDQSTGVPQSYAWDFKNDKTIDSTLKSPSFTYTTAGTYTVNLTVTNAERERQRDQNRVYQGSLLQGNNYGCRLQHNSLPVLRRENTRWPCSSPTSRFQQVPRTYKWDVNNDGVTDYTTKNPSHTYTSAGTYTVKLTVTNASGSDSEIKTGYITATSSAVVPATRIRCRIKPDGDIRSAAAPGIRPIRVQPPLIRSGPLQNSRAIWLGDRPRQRQDR